MLTKNIAVKCVGCGWWWLFFRQLSGWARYLSSSGLHMKIHSSGREPLEKWALPFSCASSKSGIIVGMAWGEIGLTAVACAQLCRIGFWKCALFLHCCVSSYPVTMFFTFHTGKTRAFVFRKKRMMKESGSIWNWYALLLLTGFLKGEQGS